MYIPAQQDFVSDRTDITNAHARLDAAFASIGPQKAKSYFDHMYNCLERLG